MELYLVFAGRKYYPNGGSRDLIACLPNERSAINMSNELITDYDWAHVLSVFEGETNYDNKIIYEASNGIFD